MILIGDLNAKHRSSKCNRANQSGNILSKYLSIRELVHLSPDKPTYYPYDNNKKTSTIGFPIIKNITSQINLEVLNELDSDHLPIIVKLNHNNTTYESTFFIYSKANWTKFRISLSDKIDLTFKIKCKADVELAVSRITQQISLRHGTENQRQGRQKVRKGPEEHL